MNGQPQLDEPEAPRRPRAVTAIGRTWLVAGIFLFAVAVVDVIIWTVLRPAMPTLLGYATQRDPSLRFLAPLFEHYATVKVIEAIFAAGAAISAYHFLNLRRWARAALEAASWLYLTYLAAFACLALTLGRRALDPAAVPGPHARERLIGGAGIGVLLVAGLIWMIVLLRSRKVRDAMAPASGSDALR